MWLLEKIRGSVETNVLRQAEGGEKQGKVPAYSNVLTPDKIPDFFIPPKLMCCPPEGEEPDAKPKAVLRPSTSEQAIGGRKPPGSPRSPRLLSKLAGDTRNLLKSANRHIIQIESADETAGGNTGEFDANTNADPQSQTAMSLPYVPKAQTSYGFATLAESPHTRRKESLFHSEHTSPITSPNSQRRKGHEGNHLNPADLNAAHRQPLPLLQRRRERHLLLGRETQAKVSRAKRSFARHSSLSTDECSSADTSPSIPRRARCSLFTRGIGGGGGAGSGDHQPSSDRTRLQREHTVNLHKRGTLRLCTEYDADATRLRIRVLAAEDLYDRSCDIKGVNCCVSLYLNPGKLQKQRSTIIKNSRNPVFNEDFFFDSVPSAQVKNLAVKMKVVNKGTSLKRDTLLGEREVPLKDLLSGV
ncbi:hypothetical protein SKAU_G00117720 [Synaphobranchus kaupii]|uniref:C2 domain-containing protein n=1 Tax=Synaphobranchus kaupii TaxID=118154 RepID=A0A9Q1FNE8_SYNKA|nr:hypothetical protein SKAU_G00117720 [Synaphobranchus kaupii]